MKYALVTGAASGIGKAISEALSKKEWRVFACDYNKEALEEINNKNIVPIFMDVTDKKSIESAFRKILKETIYLDVIINSAGTILMSSLIEEDIEKIQRMMDVNLFGIIRVNKQFFPILRKEDGRIINISSECGWMSPTPFNGPYIMSKYALEAYNDSLRRELGMLGIRVIKIQPGSFKTSMHKDTVKNFRELSNSTKYFKKPLKTMAGMMRRELKNTNNMKYLTNAVIDAVQSKNPKICYRVKNSTSMSLINLLPEKLIDKIYSSTLE